jgi:hypothetical protein
VGILVLPELGQQKNGKQELNIKVSNILNQDLTLLKMLSCGID